MIAIVVSFGGIAAVGLLILSAAGLIQVIAF
jgi:hypothetical protein